MTQKNLGQVLYEAEVEAYAMYVTSKPWVELSEAQKQEYEQAAQAVAAVVRERCAQACEAAMPAGGRAWTPEQAACFCALSHVAGFIRSMK